LNFSLYSIISILIYIKIDFPDRTPDRTYDGRTPRILAAVSRTPHASRGSDSGPGGSDGRLLVSDTQILSHSNLSHQIASSANGTGQCRSHYLTGCAETERRVATRCCLVSRCGACSGWRRRECPPVECDHWTGSGDMARAFRSDLRHGMV